MPRDDGSVWYLAIEAKDAEAVLVLSLDGRLSKETAPDLERALAAAASGPHRAVVVDLAAVDYVNSAGMRAIASGAATLHRHDRILVLCGIEDIIAPSFALMGAIPHVRIEPTRERAVARARDGKDEDAISPP